MNLFSTMPVVALQVVPRVVWYRSCSATDSSLSGER